MIFFSSVSDMSSNNNKRNKLQINEAIFGKIANNDISAFEEFYYLTERSVYAMALSIVQNHDDAMDILQDTYLKIRGSAHLYKPMGKPMAWVFTITKNLALSKLRSRLHTSPISIEEMENDITFSFVEENEDKIILQAALKILSQEEREIILLHAISGFKHREIAENLGVPLATVLSKYHRGLGKLKKYMKEGEM